MKSAIKLTVGQVITFTNPSGLVSIKVVSVTDKSWFGSMGKEKGRKRYGFATLESWTKYADFKIA